MSDSRVSRSRAGLAMATALLIGVLEVVGLGLLALGFLRYPGVDPFDYWREGALNSVPFGLLSIVLILKRPDNMVSWLFAALSLAGSLQLAAGQYGTLSFRGDFGWPLEVPALWASTVAQTALVMFFIAIVLYFPTGKLLSRAWTPVAVLLSVGLVAQIFKEAVAPGPLDLAPGVRNPYALEGMNGLVQAIEIVSSAALVGLAGAIVGLVMRFRRSAGIERQQMKWFVFTTVVGILLLFGLSAVVPGLTEGVGGNLLWAFVPAAIGVSAGVSILRYRLYDIDLVINRTLVYATLTGLLALAYLGLVVVLQRILAPVTRDSDLAVAGSTLAVAALFRPLRARVQSFIDKRFYRSRYDAAETLEAFSARLRDRVDIRSLSNELVSAVGTTMQPAHAALWLTAPEHGTRSEEADVG